MPALYGITSNANVSVSNTTGLYIGSGNVTILNSAGTLLNLLSNAGTVGFYSTNSGTQVAASVDPSGVAAGTYGSDIAIPVITVGADGRVTSVTVATNAGGSYGNANVTALLSGTVTVGNLITTAGVYWANGAPYSSGGGGGTIYGNANVAAYLAANTDPTIQSLNANTAQQQSQINTITANIGSFYTYANATYSTIANAASQESEISSLRGNITAANAAIQTLNANVGSFYTYANVTYATNANLASTNANLAAFETYANLTFGTSNYSNANVTSYLPIYSGAINNSSTIIGINANVTAANASIQTLNANVGSFYTYANATYSTIANAASQESEISSLRSNITAANASIQTISANLGSFETYANVTYATNANLTAFETYANVTFVTTANANTYSNANVAAYLAANTDPTISNLNANTSQQAAQINSINANIGSFYTYANVTYSTIANAASQQAQIDSTNANVTAANAAIQTISANLGSFETYANVTYSTIANAASQQAQIDSTNANVTAANAAIQTISANLGSFETYANVTFVTTANATIYSNANVASYLPVYNGNLEVANVNISQFATFATITTPTYLKGQVWYDSVQDSLAYYNSITNNEIHIGQELQFNVYNGTGSTINQGVPVYLTGGSVGTTPNIAPAQANTISTSQVAGVANQNIPNNTIGCVVTNGIVANVAMGTFSVGDTLYLSPYSAGILQNTVPPTGFICKVGTVVYNNSPNGRFLVNKIVPLNNQYFGNLTLTGNLSANNATITNQLSVGNIIATGTETAGNIITTAGVYWANGVSYGSSFAGTYSNTNVAAYLSGNITTGNITNTGVITSTGNITAPNFLGTAQYFSGNLAGNVLFDGVNQRMFANTYPLSTPSSYVTLGTTSNNFIGPQYAPVYSGGALQPPTFGYTGGAQTAGFLATGNILLASASGANGVKTTIGHALYNQFTPVGTMNNNDRIRSVAQALDLTLNGQTYGSNFNYNSQTNTTAVGLFGVATATGPGSINAIVGAQLIGGVNPGQSGTTTVQYATGVQGISGWNTPALVSSSAIYPSTIVYARSFNVSMNGLVNSNVSITNAVGLHVSNTWASSGTITNKYSVLVDATDSPIQTASNIIIASGSGKGITYQDGSYQTTAATTFSGDLHGNVLYDSVNERFFANAYPLSTPDNTKYANGFTTWIVPTPVYTAGVVQAPAAGSGLATQGGQTLGAIMSANVYIAPAGGAGNRSTNGHMAYTQVMPTSNMANVDRSRGLFSQLDVNLNGTTWGTMGSASQASLLLCASAGTTQLLGSGSAAHAVGFNSVVAVAPTNGNISVQYATGTYNFISLASNSAVNGTTIQYARLVSGSVAGLSANLSIVNMIGLHTASGWATIGSFTPTNRYAVLNEDADTVIQTNGNVVITGNTILKAYQETVTAPGGTGGALTVNVNNGTIQKFTLSSNISSLTFTNMPPGGSVTLILTQGGTGNNTLTTTGIKYAGGYNILSTATGAIDILNITYDGVYYYASLNTGYV